MHPILYSITRFVLEFFRGELSTSQYISIVLFIGGVVLLGFIVRQGRQGDRQSVTKLRVRRRIKRKRLNLLFKKETNILQT